MSEEQSFRKAAVGGFHRKDVIDYIEQLLIEQAACQKALAEKDAQIAALKEQVAALEQKIAGMESDREAAPAITGADEPEEVLKKVDRLLKCYLGADTAAEPGAEE